MNAVWKRFRPSQFSLRHMAADSVLILASLYLSLWLRLGDNRLGDHLDSLNTLALGFLVLRLLTFLAFGVYQSLWRYISTYDARRLALAVVCSLPLLISFAYALPQAGYLPRSLFFIDAFVSTTFLLSLRLLRRQLFERQMQPQKSQQSLGRLMIYGCGQNGRLLAQRLMNDPNRDRDLLGFIDDDPAKRNRVIHGLPVLGNHQDLEKLLTHTGCTDLIVAISQPPPERMRELVMLGRKHHVRIQRIAHFDSTTAAARTEATYRPVELKDLLNRGHTAIDLTAVRNLIHGHVVLVTGAGGSIGAELSRQIARLQPKLLLLLDHSEFNLYEIDRELRPQADDFSRVIPLLMDITHKQLLSEVFSTYRPQIVFHAAAYKHVHLVEANRDSAITNNIGGTLNLLSLCEDHFVERFVMISTDKAVNPVGAMGASKRVCERLTSAIGQKTGRAYSSVRFGNVLGSSGSLIPLLQTQIQNGGPVTITHPEMSRYFMLIPEAVSLVLMSATLSEPGDINVLKMGEPIRIQDLARSLIALMGRTEEEIAIAYTGIRPGEKMFEELYLTGAEKTTRHPDILTLPQSSGIQSELSLMHLKAQIAQLLKKAEQGQVRLEDLLTLANEEVSASPVLHS